MTITIKRAQRTHADVSRTPLLDPSLPMDAKGLYSVLAACENDQKISLDWLASLSSDGEDSLKRMLRSLRQAGYLLQTSYPEGPRGSWVWEYEIFETPEDPAFTSETRRLPSRLSTVNGKKGYGQSAASVATEEENGANTGFDRRGFDGRRSEPLQDPDPGSNYQDPDPRSNEFKMDLDPEKPTPRTRLSAAELTTQQEEQHRQALEAAERQRLELLRREREASRPEAEITPPVPASPPAQPAAAAPCPEIERGPDELPPEVAAAAAAMVGRSLAERRTEAVRLGLEGLMLGAFIFASGTGAAAPPPAPEKVRQHKDAEAAVAKAQGRGAVPVDPDRARLAALPGDQMVRELYEAHIKPHAVSHYSDFKGDHTLPKIAAWAAQQPENVRLAFAECIRYSGQCGTRLMAIVARNFEKKGMAIQYA